MNDKEYESNGLFSSHILDSEVVSSEDNLPNEKSKQPSLPHKPSINSAILSILSAPTPSENPILSKNLRPFKNLAKSLEEQKSKKEKLLTSEKLRKQGRVFPSLDENEYEKNLQMIATKGVVRLFNAVSHQQTEIKREHVKDEQLRKEFVSKKLEMDKGKVNSNDTIVRKIMEKEKRWKVFEDDENEEE
jgi:hypothetical protein